MKDSPKTQGRFIIKHCMDEKTQKHTVHQLTLGANRGLQISASATQSTKDLLKKKKLICRTLLYCPARTQFCSAGLWAGCPCSLTPHSNTLSPSLGSNSARQAHIEHWLSQTGSNGNITLCFLNKLKFHPCFSENLNTSYSIPSAVHG